MAQKIRCYRTIIIAKLSTQPQIQDANLRRSVLIEKLLVELTYNKCERYINCLSTKRKLFGSTDINRTAQLIK